MSYPANSEAELQIVIRELRAVIVAGTGVSIAASSHPQASWAGLLENGLEWLREHKLVEADEADAQLMLLNTKPQTHRFISAAQDITANMGGVSSKHFREWLARTVGAIKAKDRAVLDALDALRVHGHLLATTNYDGLLLGEPPKLDAITWKETAELISAVRVWNTDKIIFLHGYWRKPASVILDWNSYEEISRDEAYREDLAAFWRTNTWVYVGCGVHGLSDPDFGLLLERYAGRARQAGHWDYCLVCGEAQRHEFQAHFDTLKLNIRAVSYGEQRSELPGFLCSLLPPPFIGPIAPLQVTPPGCTESVPTPPAFYADRDYIGRHTFVGRAPQLQLLSDWAKPSESANVLLFEAIGGNGKSMLTWEWTTKYAVNARTGHEPWAGRFWYSFYEKGAIMRDFCQHALAYMTGQPLETFAKRPMADLRNDLLAQLHRCPWLLILDGLERVLVAYHRIDASEVPDEEVNRPTDKILNRDPRDAIRDEDTDLLRALAAAAPSKILISSRLMPRALLNPSGLPLPGVKPLELKGLDEPDAEALLCSCGVKGTSADIRYYLTNYCENHPLVIGVLASLINSPGPHRGDFDAWAADPDYGAKLNLASLDLIQSRNHILRAALDALEPASRQLLSTLALLSDAVDYPTVVAFNPHIPPEPTFVSDPDEGSRPLTAAERKETERAYRALSPEKKKEADAADEKAQKEYDEAIERREEYLKALAAWKIIASSPAAHKKLAEALSDLETRAFLQFDRRTNMYDLHPVVRGIASGSQEADERAGIGQRVVDHFSSQPHNPYRQAKTMEDVENGLHVVRTLLKLGHHQQAADAYRGDLSQALRVNLEAHVETLSLLRPFFPAGWDALPKDVAVSDASYLANAAAMALDYCGELQKALGPYGAALRSDLETEKWRDANTSVRNISRNLADQNLISKALRVDSLALDLATVHEDDEAIFVSRLFLFGDQSRLGQWQAAEATWRLLDPMGRDWTRAVYRQGMAEGGFAVSQFFQGTLQEEHLTVAAILAAEDDNRPTLRGLYWLRGVWRLGQGQWALAAASFGLGVTMARERRLVDEASETGLALAKFHLAQLTGDAARSEAERLAQLRDPAHRTLALLWLAIGDRKQAKAHALAAYSRAWADGEPYVNRYELTKTTELLQQMNLPVPVLPPYDPAKDEPFPWEADVRTAIERLRAEKEAKKNAVQAE